MSIERHWYGSAKRLWWLWPLQWLFALLTALRRQLYRWHLLPSFRAPIPVVVVGNITVGGSGKTPLVVALIEYLKQQQFKPGVVSRGYGGKADGYPYVVSGQSSATQCGDEPLLIYQRTQVPVVVDPNRVRAAQKLLEFGCDIILSDDGLQHYSLARDIEIVVVDAVRQFGNRQLLPTGPLRESIRRLRRADLVICNGGILPAISEHGFALDLQQEVSLHSRQQQKPLSSVRGRPVHAFAGIGHPQRFFDALKALDLQVIAHPQADHQAYSREQFRDLSGVILMTEKDAVKCRDFGLESAWYVPVEARFLSDFLPAFDNRLAKLNKS